MPPHKKSYLTVHTQKKTQNPMNYVIFLATTSPFKYIFHVERTIKYLLTFKKKMEIKDIAGDDMT